MHVFLLCKYVRIYHNSKYKLPTDYDCLYLFGIHGINNTCWLLQGRAAYNQIHEISREKL